MAKRIKTTTTWHKHLKVFGASEGTLKTVIFVVKLSLSSPKMERKINDEGAAAFMKAVSESHKSLGPQERQFLENDTTPPTTMSTCTVGDIKKQAKNASQKFSCW